MRIMEKLTTDAHLVAWRAALWQLASDGADVTKIECFTTDADGDSRSAPSRSGGLGSLAGEQFAASWSDVLNRTIAYEPTQTCVRAVRF